METEIEKRVHYLRGILTGIQYGASAPNAFRYKQQIDFELKALEARLLSSKRANPPSPLLASTSTSATASATASAPKIIRRASPSESVVAEAEAEPGVAEVDTEVEAEAEADPVKKRQRVAVAFVEVSRRINGLREKVHVCNNTIHGLLRKNSFQNGTRAQHLQKVIVQCQAEIQYLQARYNVLEAFLKNEQLQQQQQQQPRTTPAPKPIRKMVRPASQTPSSTTTTTTTTTTSTLPKPTATFTPKSILKKKLVLEEDGEGEEEARPRERRVSVNTDANQVAEIPSVSGPKKRLVFTQKPVEEAKSKTMENEDADMIRELQSTLGSIQKLLI